MPTPIPTPAFQLAVTSPTQGAVLVESATMSVTWRYSGTPSPATMQNGVNILLTESNGSMTQRVPLATGLQISRGGAAAQLPNNFLVNPGIGGVSCEISIMDVTSGSELAHTPNLQCKYAFTQ